MSFNSHRDQRITSIENEEEKKDAGNQNEPMNIQQEYYEEDDSLSFQEIEIQKKRLHLEILELEKKKLLKKRSMSASRRSIGFYPKSQPDLDNQGIQVIPGVASDAESFEYFTKEQLSDGLSDNKGRKTMLEVNTP